MSDAFLSQVGHELRTPLNAITGYSEILLEDAEDRCPDDFVSDLRKIHTSSKQLLVVVNDILQSLQTENSESPGSLEAIGTQVRYALRTPLHSIIGYSEILAEEARELGQASLVPDLRKIHDAGQRLLTFVEDIRNLTRHGAGGARSKTRGAHEQLRKIVSSFFSETEEQPLSKPRCGTLLVVDDNEMNRDVLSRRLERLGHAVAVAENGRKALELMAHEKFDLVLLDMMMPEMTGDEVLRRLKADAALRHVPVIMISALDEIDEVAKCIEMGAEDYLPKPFNPVLLKARIEACLEKMQLRDREVTHLRQIEAEKKRSDELLHVIFPSVIVEELKTTQEVKPRRYENVAVLFSDVVGFTSYCEDRRPEEVLSLLQELTELFEELAVRHDLEKMKTIGDAFMATAGLLKPVRNPVLNCVKCGLAMVSGVQRLSSAWQVRVGIHTGPVIAGVVGHKKYLFDIWGDTVNTAARVESNGVNSAVNVSKEAWNHIADHCHGESRGLVDVKGKGKLEMYRVDGLKM
ncbi:MAG: response regulator [Armatimonadetes bacterium]|nr:response regulator [Armatimonadota bacterium]